MICDYFLKLALSLAEECEETCPLWRSGGDRWPGVTMSADARRKVTIRCMKKSLTHPDLPCQHCNGKFPKTEEAFRDHFLESEAALIKEKKMTSWQQSIPENENKLDPDDMIVGCAKCNKFHTVKIKDYNPNTWECPYCKAEDI